MTGLDLLIRMLISYTYQISVYYHSKQFHSKLVMEMKSFLGDIIIDDELSDMCGEYCSTIYYNDNGEYKQVSISYK